MLDGYEEIWGMAKKLGLPAKPLWYDLNGCPRWKEPEEDLKKFVKPIRCQACGQMFMVCLVDDVYRSYGQGIYDHIRFSGKLPRDWHYGDPPTHPTQWTPGWWEGGWNTVCMGVTMTSIPEPEFECYKFHEDGKVPEYKDEFLLERRREKS